MTAPSDAQTSRTASQSGVAPRAHLALLGGVLCIGLGPIFIRLADVTGDVLGVYRLGIAALVLTPAAWLNWRSGRARLPRAKLGLALLGGLAFAANIFIWSTALRLTTIANATFLDNTAPVWVGLGAWLLFGERLRPLYWGGLALALAGGALLVGPGGFDGSAASVGNVLAIAGAVIYAAYLLVTERVRESVDNLTYVWLFSGVAAVSLLILSLALGSPLVGLPRQSYAALLGVALISQVGGWLLINYAFGHLRASLVSVTLLGQPVVATLLAAPLFGEMPGLPTVLGGLVTLAGIYTVHRSVSAPSHAAEVPHAD